jgi:hypothetical protein
MRSSSARNLVEGPSEKAWTDCYGLIGFWEEPLVSFFSADDADF